MTADLAPEGTLMTLVQFKYVLEIAKTGSVNQAANNLFVSQSVLSNALKTLEKELGQLIFYRMTTGMQLTPFGDRFLPAPDSAGRRQHRVRRRLARCALAA